MPEEISDAELITTAINHRMIDWHTAMPGRVERYYPERNSCDVFPMLSARIPCDDGDVMIEQLPVIPDVKLIFQRAGGFGITFPVQKGDFVLLVFCEAPLGAWRQTANAGDPYDPERLGLSGAVAIPGIYPDNQNIANPDTSNMVLGKIGTPSAQIEITPTEVHLGAGATDFVALASKVNANFDTLFQLLDGVAGASSGAIAATAPPAVDAFYFALKAAIATVAGSGKWPNTSVAAATSKAK